MRFKLTIAALALGLALPAAAATIATIAPPATLPPCVTSGKDATPKAADPTCTPVALGANIIPLATSGDEGSDEDGEGGDND